MVLNLYQLLEPYKVRKEHKDDKDLVVFKELQALKVTKDQLVFKVLMVLKVTKVLLEPEHKVHKEIKVLMEHLQQLLVLKEIKVLLVFKVL